MNFIRKWKRRDQLKLNIESYEGKMARKLKGVVADACARVCERGGVESDEH